LLLADAIDLFRRAMFQVGRVCALDPDFGAKADANPGIFYALFGGIGLDTELLEEPAAVEGFREGVKSAREM
jgi:hypothetical protein